MNQLPPAEIVQTELDEIEADRRRMGVIAWVLGAWFIIAAGVGAWVAL